MSARTARWLLIVMVVLIGNGTLGVHTQAVPAPILVITNSSAPNQYGAYLAEILRAEGLNQFTVKDLSTVTATDLTNAQVTVLAETPLTPTQANLLSNYVAGGGRLVAMRPDSQLTPVLGLSPAGSSTSEGYFAFNAATAFADGFPTTTLPFHGQAVNYTAANGATTLATLYSNSTTATSFPAVIKFGRTVTWAYDLVRSVVYTRQGNPANATERDGQLPYRTEDLFYNAIDRDKVNIPYADVQIRMLGRVISDLLADMMPLPRLWYFPGSTRTMMVVTSDSHANPQSYFDQVISSVEARGGHVSMYMYGGVDPSVSSTMTWKANGHEVGMHPAAYQHGITLTQAFQNNLDYFQLNGYGTPSPTTRIHQLEWQGWVDAAKIEASFGIALDTSFYTWGPAVTYPDGHQAHGYINGSGLPMRFIDEAGAVVPVYQQVTSVIDEQLIVGGASEQLTPQQALSVTQQLIDESQAGGYSAITTQFHVDYFGFGEVRPWAEGTMDYARNLGIPMWTTKRWLNYTTARAATTVTSFSWSPAFRQLAFTVGVPANSDPQSVALPGAYGGFGVNEVLIDGVSVSVAAQTITGRDTRFINISSGTHTVVATYGTTTPPTEHPPVAIADTANVMEGQTVVIPVLANDFDVDGDALTVVSTSADAGAVITINADQTISYTPNPGTCGLDTFSYTVSDGRGGTASADVTVTVTCASGQVTHSTFADLAPSCAVPAGTLVTQVGDGEVRLTGLQGDEYSQAPLDSSKWVAGTWSGGTYTPSPAGGLLSLANTTGAYVRSVSALSISTLESSARFSGLPWEHVGWGSLDFGAGYAIVSTYNTTTSLFARTNDGSGEQQTSLGPIPAGFHTYHIERQVVSPTSNIVSYYVDGVLRAQHTVGTLPSMYVYQSHNGGTAQTLDIDRIWVYPTYAGSGTYQSCTMDIGNALSTWTTATWSAAIPSGTTLQLRTRTSSDGTTWSGWSSPLTNGGVITSPAGRYLQYLTDFATTDSGQSPVLDSVTMRFNNGSLPVSLSINDVAVAEGNAGTLTASFTVSLSGPSDQPVTFSYATAPGTATSPADYASTSGTLTFDPGVTSLPINVTINGDTTLEPNETFVVNLSGAGNATIADAQGRGTILNDDPPAIAINNVSVTEGNSGTVNAAFTVTLSQPTTATVTVNYATADGTATSGSDYLSGSGQLTFSPGATSASVVVTVNGDTLAEANETFSVNLSGATNATLGSAQGTATIVNDDATASPTFSINDVTVTEGNSGTSTAMFTVSLSAASTQSATVDFATANGTAVNASDYFAFSGTLTFSPGVTTRTISVAIIGDTLFEGNETFRVNLTGATGATIAKAQGICTIVDNDVATIRVTAPNTAVTWLVGTTRAITWTNNLGTAATVRLELSRDGGSTWSLLASSVRNSTATGGSFNWAVTTPVTSTARIRATSTANAAVTDSSDVNFTIALPQVTVLSPNGGEVWTAGTTGTVSWSSNLPASDSVRIELSTDGGASYPIVLSSSTANDGSTSVGVQSAWLSTQARVRVRWLTNTSVNDASNANFTIQ